MKLLKLQTIDQKNSNISEIHLIVCWPDPVDRSGDLISRRDLKLHLERQPIWQKLGPGSKISLERPIQG